MSTPDTSQDRPTIKLKKGEERRLLAGHLWVFSNEIDVAATPLKTFEPGTEISIESSRGAVIGSGYVNPRSLIAARLCSRDGKALDRQWFHQRLQSALRLRDQFYTRPWYRLVHGEGDFMPGVVIDRYDEVLIVQVTTAGMERHIDTLVEVLVALLAPKTILLRNDTSIRELEGLALYQKAVVGEVPSTLVVEENDLHYEVPWSSGQKTGWFYDHRDNRCAIGPLVKGKRVLDCYAYMGAWGLNALAQGAEQVLCVDSSVAAVQAAVHNADLNNLSGKFAATAGDAVETLRDLRHQNERFDVVILDPPAFIKRRKDMRAGLAHYELNHKLATALLKDDGVIISASCSQPLGESDLSGAMLKGARRHGYDLQLLQSLGQARDHPVNAAMSETRYLKGIVGRLCSSRPARRAASTSADE